MMKTSTHSDMTGQSLDLPAASAGPVADICGSLRVCMQTWMMAQAFADTTTKQHGSAAVMRSARSSVGLWEGMRCFRSS